MQLHREKYAYSLGDHLPRGYGTTVGSFGGEDIYTDTSLIMVCRSEDDTYRVELWHRDLANNPNTNGPDGFGTYGEAVDAAFAFASERGGK